MIVGRHTKENVYLKQQYTAYLQSKNLAPATINCYIHNLSLFLTWIDKEETQVTKPDVLKYLEYLNTKRQQQNITRRNALIAINHYFTFLLTTSHITSNPAALIKIRGTKKKQLYKTYSPEALDQIFDTYYLLFIKNYSDTHIPKNQRKQAYLSRQRNTALLSLLIYQGLKTSEFDNLFLNDIDFIKATIKINGGAKKGSERTLPLKASQIGLLLNYTQNIREQFFAYCKDASTGSADKLFFALPASGKKTNHSHSLKHAFKPLAKQVKSLDKSFIDFRQVRASVITTWLKTEGLRKTQYMAGHRKINSTEEYLPNEIEGLTEDITKFNPF
jgi:site-specific recombinase XerD